MRASKDLEKVIKEKDLENAEELVYELIEDVKKAIEV